MVLASVSTVARPGCPAATSCLIATGILPQSWSHYTVPAGMTVIQWVSDFSERIKQLQSISLAAASGGAKELKVGTRCGSPGGAHEATLSSEPA